jgi:CRISPR-associated protein (TIGR02584 family)
MDNQKEFGRVMDAGKGAIMRGSAGWRSSHHERTLKLVTRCRKLATAPHRVAACHVLRQQSAEPMPPKFDRPETYPRRILLAVSGLSPQIVTESLYALAVKRAWVPTEIRLITTRRGAQEAERTLLSDDPGWLYRLCADYRLTRIAFGPDHIHLITGPHGEPLDDILTEPDNAAVADFITEQMRSLTADPGASLHVSIAGGRKTMGFYLGYALSLLGREQDRLSHVLVSPPFEQFPEFFYPPPHARFVRDRDGRTLDAREAQVYLGEIPFIRLRDGLPDHVLRGRTRFSEAVAEAQKALPPVALRLDPATRTVTAGGESLVLEPAQFAFYWMTAERCAAGRDGAHWTDPSIAEELLGFYGQLVNPASGAYENAEKVYREKSGKYEFKYLFDPPKTRVNSALRQALGVRRAVPYLIGKLERIPIPGKRYHRFGLSLPPETITIATASLPAPRRMAGGIQHGSPKETRSGRAGIGSR